MQHRHSTVTADATNAFERAVWSRQGKYHKRENVTTLAPSMDICISSNFERFLFHLCDDNTEVRRRSPIRSFVSAAPVKAAQAALSDQQLRIFSASSHLFSRVHAAVADSGWLDEWI